MVSLDRLQVGMNIKIVDEWNENSGENKEGLMDQWLGQIVTVSEVYPNYCVLVEEDNRRWAWYPSAIDCIVDGTESDFDAASEDELSDFIFGR